MTIRAETLEILRCPECLTALAQSDDCLHCAAGHEFALDDGIPILLPRSPNAERSGASALYYDRAATNHEALDEFWQNPYDQATWRLENELILSHMSGLEPVLDLGTGFYPHVESTAARRVLCADISRNSLAVARTLFGDRNQRMEYVCCDATRLPVEAASIPAVIAGGELVNHVPAPDLVREIRRVLAPQGRALLSVGMKWCFDSLYSVADAILGLGLGYSMTREEAWAFLRYPARSTSVTWEVTPERDLRLVLQARGELLRTLRQAALRVVDVRSLNLVSGLIPLPVQQGPARRPWLRWLGEKTLQVERRALGRVPGLRWFAGNVYLILAHS